MTTLGTLNDFDSLVERGHGLGLKMLIDLVLSHTAEIWADARSDGTPPSKWLSVFGGSSRERDVERMQYYSRNFLPEQPNLNFHNPEVQDAVLDVLRLSLNRGLDGFCLDVVNSCFHDPRLRKNPPLDSDLRKAMTAPAVNPYNFQDYLFDKTQPEILAFLERLRALPDTYPAKMTGGEVGEAQRGTALQAAYTAGDRRLHICYGFEKLTGAFPSGSRIGAILVDFERGGRDSWSCWAFSNDDVPRHPSRSGLSEAELRLCRAILCSLRVSICLYQGEDGLRFSPKFEGRDRLLHAAALDGGGAPCRLLGNRPLFANGDGASRPRCLGAGARPWLHAEFLPRAPRFRPGACAAHQRRRDAVPRR